MRRIMVVDDDKEFLTSVRILLKAHGFQVTVYSEPVEALKMIPQDDPEIIVTDMMMPGIHGLDFLTIACHIVRSAAVVVISANTIQQLARDFGKSVWADVTYFHKPLNETFFAHLNALAAKNDSPVADTSAAGQGRQQTSPLPVDQLNKLAVVYENVQGLIWEMALKKWVSIETEYGAWQAAHNNLSAILEVLAQNEEGRAQILLNLERSRGSWRRRVRENLSRFVPTVTSVHFNEPFLLDETALSQRFHGFGPVRSVAMTVDGGFKAKLLINERAVDLKVDLFDCDESRVVSASRFFQEIVDLAQRSTQQHLRSFWWPDLRFEQTRAAACTVYFPKLWTTSFGAVIEIQSNADSLQAVVTLQDGSSLPVAKTVLLREPLPSECIFKGQCSVTVKIDPVSLVVTARLDDSDLPDPLAAGEKAASQRGYASDGTKYWRTSWAFRYLWSVAMDGGSEARVRSDGKTDQASLGKASTVRRRLFGG